MQTHTRIAIGLGVVVVVVGGYFFYDSAKPPPIELEDTATSVDQPEAMSGPPGREKKLAAGGQTEPDESVFELTPQSVPPAPAEPDEAPTSSLTLPKLVAPEPDEAAVPPSGTDVVWTDTSVGEPSAGTAVPEREAAEVRPAPRLAAVVPEPPKEKMRQHVVKAGDTFSSLAVEYYGSQRYTQQLIAANPQVSDPDVLKIGMKLNIPPLSAAEKARTARAGQGAGRRPKALKANQYIVKPGDTIYTIARDQLGDERRWPELYEINKELFPRGPHTIKAGTVIYLSEPQER